MVSSIGMGVKPVGGVHFSGRPAKVGDVLMRKLHALLDQEAAETFVYREVGEKDLHTIITRRRLSTPLGEPPVEIEFLMMKGSRQILLNADGTVREARCAGLESQRPFSRQQAQQLVEDFLVLLFENP